MTGTTTIFADGITDVHVANGVARIMLAMNAGQKDAPPVPTGCLAVPVVQLPALARLLAEVTRQVEAKAKEAIAAAQAARQPADGAPAAGSDQLSGAFRFSG
jgi:hypothetical protein